MQQFRLLFFLLFFACYFQASAQVSQPGQTITTSGQPQNKQKKDTIQRHLIPGGKTYYTTIEDMVELPGKQRPVDTLQDNIQQFDPGYLHNLGNNYTPAF